MRRGEILGLRNTNIDMDNGVIHVRRTLHKENGEIFVTEGTKNVKQLKKENHKNRLRFGPAYNQGHDYLLLAPDGSIHPPDSVSRVFRHRAEKNGIFDVTFHSLRHTFATLMIEMGVSHKVVQDLLGHKTAQTTLDVYAHVKPEMHMEAFAKINEILK